MVHLSLRNIKKYYGGNLILSDITFEAMVGEKVGIIGRNGTGKTTIFKVINGIERPEEGLISIRKDTTIGYLDQIPVFPEKYTVKTVLDTAFEKEYSVLDKMKGLEEAMASTTVTDRLVKEYGDLQQLFTALGGYEIDEKLSKVCEGLKISDEMKERVFNTLSGGEKTTILLARILLKACDLLLLDEPSNHLDLESIEWLEEYIREYKGTIIIISHDRYFLDNTVNKIIEIEDGVAEVYLGNYSFYVEDKSRKYLIALEDYQNQQKKIKAMEDSIKRFKDWGNRGDNPKFHKKAASIQKRLNKLDRMKKPLADRRRIQIDFNSNRSTSRDVISVNLVKKSFDDKLILNDLDLLVRQGEKVAILGKNGSGKTTLFKLIIGEDIPDEGEIKLGASAKIGYLQQNLSFPDESHTVLEVLQRSCGFKEGEARNKLAAFLFYGEDVFKKVGTLSGGERSRLRLCQLMHQDINTLILDEPTNHLDIDSREMLEETLDEFEGTVVFISHDRYFINSIAEKIYELRSNRLTEYVGDYDYYRLKRRELMEVHSNSTEGKDSKRVTVEKENNNKGNAGKKRNEFAIRRLEEDIAKLEVELEKIDQDIMNNPTDYMTLQQLNNTRSTLANQLDGLMEKWLELTSVE